MSAQLPDLQAVTAHAADMFEEATGRILLFAAPAVVRDLKESLASAHLRGCLTEVICINPVAGIRGGFTIVPESEAPAAAWLLLVVDGEHWLLASNPADAGEPAGCWGRQRPVAAALSAVLDTLRRTGVHRAEMAAAEGCTVRDVGGRRMNDRPPT